MPVVLVDCVYVCIRMRFCVKFSYEGRSYDSMRQMTSGVLFRLRATLPLLWHDARDRPAKMATDLVTTDNQKGREPFTYMHNPISANFRLCSSYGSTTRRPCGLGTFVLHDCKPCYINKLKKIKSSTMAPITNSTD